MTREIVQAYRDRLRQCPACRIWFAPLRKSATYCCDACRQKAFRDARKP